MVRIGADVAVRAFQPIRRHPAFHKFELGRVARLGQWIERTFEVTLPGGHFLVVPGLPRPAWLGGGSEALAVEEIIALLRRPPSTDDLASPPG